MYVIHSNEFRQFEDDLISNDRWSQRDAVLAEMGQQFLQSPSSETLAGLRASFDDRLLAINQRLADSVNSDI